MNLRKSLSYIIDIGFLAAFYFGARGGWYESLIPSQLAPFWTAIFALSQVLFFILFSLLVLSDYSSLKTLFDKINGAARWYWHLLLIPLFLFNFVLNMVYFAATLTDSDMFANEAAVLTTASIMITSTLAFAALMFLRDPTAHNPDVVPKIYAAIGRHTLIYFLFVGFAAVYSPVYAFYTAIRTFHFAPPKSTIAISENLKTLYLILMNFLLGFITLNILNFEYSQHIENAGIYRFALIFVFGYLPYKLSIWFVDPSWKKSWTEALWPLIYFAAQLGIILSART